MLGHASRATALFLLLLAAVWAAPGYAISKEFNQSYPLQPGGSFELQNVNGAVEVQGWDRNEIEVHAVKTAKSRESDLERSRHAAGAHRAVVEQDEDAAGAVGDTRGQEPREQVVQRGGRGFRHRDRPRLGLRHRDRVLHGL